MKSRTSRVLAAVVGIGALIAPTAAAVAAPPSTAPAAVTTAKPGTQPDIAALAGPLADQELVWEDQCDFGYGDELNEMIWQLAPGSQCATVTVPRDWTNPQDGNTITIRISRYGTAVDPDRREGIMLVNPGGPGGSGLIFGPYIGILAPQLAEEYEMVGFDPRGVGQSTPLLCEYVPDYEDWWQDGVNLVEGCADNPLTPYITTEQTAYDMDLVRHLLGEPQMSYLGYSYGTWLGSWYQRVFPSHVHRFLLDSNTDLSRKSLEETWDLQPKSRDRQFQEMMLPYVARNDATYGLGTDPIEIRRQWELAGGTRDPMGQLVAGAILIPAMYNTADYPIAAEAIAMFINGDFGGAAAGSEELRAQVRTFSAQLREGTDEATRVVLERAEQKMLDEVDTQAAALAEEPVLVDASFSAIRCQDGPWHDSRGYWDSWVNQLQRKFPFIGPMMGPPECATWEHVTEMPRVKGNVYPDTLLLQTEMDAATPYEAGLRSAQVIPNTSLISVNNEGTHAPYPYYDSCLDPQVDGWLLDGDLPAEWGVCQAKPLPGEDVTYEVGGLVKGNGKIKIKERTDEMKQVERMVRGILAQEQPLG